MNCGTVWCLLSVMSQLLCGAIRSTALGTSDSVSCTVCVRRGGEEQESDTTCRNIVSRLTPCTHFAQVSASPGKTSLRGQACTVQFFRKLIIILTSISSQGRPCMSRACPVSNADNLWEQDLLIAISHPSKVLILVQFCFVLVWLGYDSVMFWFDLVMILSCFLALGCNIAISTYSMVSHSQKRSWESEKVRLDVVQ